MEIILNSIRTLKATSYKFIYVSVMLIFSWNNFSPIVRFHQIQRRARVKEQLKEFEELQKKDPEAALRKLEELERTRAEERVTLRHRSTGQWAKNLSVRAKYDKEVIDYGLIFLQYYLLLESWLPDLMYIKAGLI